MAVSVSEKGAATKKQNGKELPRLQVSWIDTCIEVHVWTNDALGTDTDTNSKTQKNI